MSSSRTPQGHQSKHLTDRTDSRTQDPQEAHRRRGSPETFDVKAYTHFLDKLLHTQERLQAPSFSHTLKDPVEGGVMVEIEDQIIILEGLYTLFTETEDWARASQKIDFKVLVRVPDSVSEERLVQRHVRSGICQDEEEATRRGE